jgi:lipoprotein-anchoring transpeptidase ErfK/SrfK
MQCVCVVALLASALGMTEAMAQPMSISSGSYADVPPARSAAVPVQYRQQGDLGGGFIEFLFSGGGARPGSRSASRSPAYANLNPADYAQRPAMDPRYLKQVVDYDGSEKPGTVIIDTPRRFLFLVEGEGKATRYGIGVGRPGFTWAGVKHITQKREWPDWRPPDEMLRRRPDLPNFMAGGPNNPLGARAMYLGSSLYRIHGSNEPWTIGQAVSSGCIRMRNEDVIDLYQRVTVGTKVVVI